MALAPRVALEPPRLPRMSAPVVILLSLNPEPCACNSAARALASPDRGPALDLQTFFNPRSVAVVGASADPGAISARPLRLLVQHGFRGPIYPVNPKYQELQGLTAYPSIGQVPEAVDLALVAVPARVVPEVLSECAEAGARNALVFSSGFGEA